ncbi:sigma-70 family RNA polymerase sigma factor [Bacillus sp. BGMRC 2118]|nr:sigma-70 family RNA polymerase sigma factor [Bacillus sp. BGMRC 2118]
MKCNAMNFINRLNKQKEDALEYIIEQFSPLVHAISYKILSPVSKEAVEECVNDVFFTVWTNANQFKGEPGDFKKWIGVITKYKAIDRLRQLEKQKGREHSDEYIEEQQDSNDIQRQLVKKEDRNTLLLALSTLPQIDRDLFIMKYFLHLPTVDIANLMDLSISAVENRLYRGRKKLAQNKQLRERFS